MINELLLYVRKLRGDVKTYEVPKDGSLNLNLFSSSPLRIYDERNDYGYPKGLEETTEEQEW